MKAHLLIIPALLTANLTAGQPLEVVMRHQAVFTAPPKKTPSDGSVDAPLMGNGDTLVALGGDASALRFYIGKNELWMMNMIDALGRWIDHNGMNSFYPAAARVGYPPETILAKMKDMLNRVGGPNGIIDRKANTVVGEYPTCLASVYPPSSPRELL